MRPAVRRILLGATAWAGAVLPSPVSAQDLAPLDSTVRALMTRDAVPGLALAIVAGDSVVALRGWGLARVSDSIRIDPERTAFRVASVAKLFNSEMTQRIAALHLKLLGLYANLWDPQREEAQHGAAAQRYLNAVSSTIGGGTSEIQRNIIATRGLGLPRG